MSRELRSGQPLYGAPSLTFTPDIYTPLYFVVAAVVSFVAGTGFVALRLVSIVASLVLLAALAKLAHRETNDSGCRVRRRRPLRRVLPDQRRMARHRARGHAVHRAAVLRSGRRARCPHGAPWGGGGRAHVAVVPHEAGRVASCDRRRRVPRRRATWSLDDRRVRRHGRASGSWGRRSSSTGSPTVGTGTTSGDCRLRTRWLAVRTSGSSRPI